MKNYVSKEQIETAREMDLLTYLRKFDPYELVRISDGVYKTRTHDSLKVSNGAWMWWSKGIGGYTALDYLIKVKGVPFVEAVTKLCDNQMNSISDSSTASNKVTYKKKQLLLPKPAPSNKIATEYLCSRGIDRHLISDCIQNGMIYESLPYHNVIFVGFDKENQPRYAGYRATNGKRILGDCSGSDKHFSFRMVGAESEDVHLFESAIDMLSFATLIKISGKDYHRLNLISLAGIYAPSRKDGEGCIPIALSDYLTDNPNTRRIFLHLDSDTKGRAATKVIESRISDKYDVIDFPPPDGKDFNDFLLICLQNRR